MFAVKEKTKRGNGAALARDKVPFLDGTSRNFRTHHSPDPVRLQQRYMGNSYFQSRPVATVQRKECDGSCGGTCPSCQRRKQLLEQIQTKLQVGPADDLYEREADRIAARVMRMPNSEATGAIADSDLPSIRRLSASNTDGQQPPANFHLGQSSGRPLSTATRQFMEPLFGTDFSHVRLHTSEKSRKMAAQIQARAFTFRNHIWLGKGESEQNRQLMAHELVHTIQQNSKTTGISRSPELIQRQCPQNIPKLYSRGNDDTRECRYETAKIDVTLELDACACSEGNDSIPVKVKYKAILAGNPRDIQPLTIGPRFRLKEYSSISTPVSPVNESPTLRHTAVDPPAGPPGDTLEAELDLITSIPCDGGSAGGLVKVQIDDSNVQQHIIWTATASSSGIDQAEISAEQLPIRMPTPLIDLSGGTGYPNFPGQPRTPGNRCDPTTGQELPP